MICPSVRAIAAFTVLAIFATQQALLAVPLGTQRALEGIHGRDVGVTEPGGELRVRLIIFGPGGALLSRFGHAAIWIEDAVSGKSVAYGYGLSRPTSRSEMILRLAGGAVWARAGLSDPESMIEQYVGDRRSVWIQDLNLSANQRWRLREYLEQQLGPGAPSYLQDFFRANCTTGVRDALDWALDGQIRDATETISTNSTYRTHIKRYAANFPFFYVGLLAALANRVDEPLSAWDEMFLPELLRDRLKEVRIRNESGLMRPLIATEETRYLSDRRPVRARPPAWWPIFLVLGLLLGAGFAMVGRRAATAATARFAFAATAAGWLLLSGILGCVLLGLWLLTDQYLAHNNANLLVFNPLAMLAADRVLTAGFGSRRALVHSKVLIQWIAAGSFCGVGLHMLPSVQQASIELLLLTVPLHTGMLWGIVQWRAAAEESARHGGGKFEVGFNAFVEP